MKTYSKILEYVLENGNKVKPDKLYEHIKYLKTISDAEKEGYQYKVKALKCLYQEGLYNTYRGNRNTYIMDRVFVLINSITRK